MREPLTILGIDPGSQILGWGAVLWRGSRDMTALDHGVIRLGGAAPGGERLVAIHHAIGRILARFEPGAVCIEEVFYGRNFQSALRIGEARGVCLLAAAQEGRAVFSYTAAEIKSAVTGNGRAHKSQVQAMVARLLALPQVPRPADAADALACALCHANRLR